MAGKLRKRPSLSKKTAGELAAFWDNILSISWTWPPPWDPGSPAAKPEPADRPLLCWWCRSIHLASEVDACMALPTRKSSTGGNGSSTSSASVGTLLKPYSELWAFLTARNFPDGSRRQTGRLSLSCDSGGLVLSCTDTQTGLYCTLKGASLDDLFLAVEAGLAANDLPWRDSKFAKPAKQQFS